MSPEQVKVKLSLCLIKHHAMKTMGGGEGIVLYGGEWSASRSGHFIHGERAAGIHWIGGWVGLRACVDVVTRNISASAGNRTPDVQPVA
jgi:hypothetical protein